MSEPTVNDASSIVLLKCSHKAELPSNNAGGSGFAVTGVP